MWPNCGGWDGAGLGGGKKGRTRRGQGGQIRCLQYEMTNAHLPGRRRTPRRFKAKAARRPAAVRRGPAAPAPASPPHESTSRPPPWPPQVPPPRRPPRVGSVLVRNPPGAWLGRKRSALRRCEPRRGVLVSARPDLHQHRHARGLPGPEARLGEHLHQHRHVRGLPGGHRPSPPPHVRPHPPPPTTPGPPLTHGRTPPARPRQLRGGGHRRRNDR